MQRGRLALQAGDTAAAERDLAPLARAGYLEAQIKLAGLYAARGTEADDKKAVAWYGTALKQDPTQDLAMARLLLRANTDESLAQAEKLMRQAESRGEPRALAELIQLYTDHPERDPFGNAQLLVQRAEKLASPAPEVRAAVVRWYRKSPAGLEFGDKLAQRCEESLDQLPECYADLVRYARASGNLDKLNAYVAQAEAARAKGLVPQPVIERVARTLVAEDLLNDSQPDIAYRLLRKDEAALTAEGQVLLARLLIDNPALDTKAEPDKMLEAAYARGSDEAALALGRLYLDGRRVTADPVRAERYFTEASRTQPAAHYFLGRLYERGDLGEATPEQALEHYLSAARAGDSRADLALAQLYIANRGVKPDRVNAYIFAMLAWRNAEPRAEETLTQLRTGMELSEAQYADLLVQQELAARAGNAGSTADAGRDGLNAHDTAGEPLHPIQPRQPELTPGGASL